MRNICKLEELPGPRLKITADITDPEIKEELEDCRDIADALDFQLCNGWEIIRPEECGALTDGLLVSKEGERNDHGELVKLGKVYWDADYQVHDALETLRTTGEVVFSGED